MRKSAPGSWKHILNSGGWESTSSQAEIPHERLVQEVTPLSCTQQPKACTGTCLQFLITGVLKGWDKPDTKQQNRDSGCQL